MESLPDGHSKRVAEEGAAIPIVVDGVGVPVGTGFCHASSCTLEGELGVMAGNQQHSSRVCWIWKVGRCIHPGASNVRFCIFQGLLQVFEPSMRGSQASCPVVPALDGS